MLKGKGSKTKKAESHARGLNPKIPHLVLPPELGSDNRRATPRTRSGNYPSSPCWT